MIEILPDDIAALTDGDLRTLVARLATAELRAQSCPLSSVTAGGDQDAPDGGLDVRVETPVALSKPDFVPRAVTGFQVKKPDMPAGEIEKEMRPNGVLRPVIAELAEASGAYIIVSAQGSVADKPLKDRRKAMRDQLKGLSTVDKLKTDFYDRTRLAAWVNEYPGIAAWVRGRVGRPLSGWSHVGAWTGTSVGEPAPYLFNDHACVTDERSKDRDQLTIADGVARLREGLRTPRQCIRLIGLSGVGKTRFVRALFESGVGVDPLDPGLALYTDYSDDTEPTAREMARRLVIAGQRAILVVDNCNPATHGELARICSEAASQVSLLTIEYDVRDDEPEQTDVLRLQASSPDLVTQWIEQSFPNVSQVDRRTIAEFSGGNFRVAGALADTLRKGETLGQLKNRDLFDRIVQQRNAHDPNLLLAAEDLSLLYSVDGEDTDDDGELARIATLRGVSAATLYQALDALKRRGIAQSRGRWRAMLPHAVANPLATYALERTSPRDFDRFCAALTPRMLKSLSRRLGYLHDSDAARTAVARWLRTDGPLGDLVDLGEAGLQILTNIAPVAPELVLARIEQELDGPQGARILDPDGGLRFQWIRLIKALAYEPQMFEQAADLLARFVIAEPEGHNSNSARDAFTELFHIHLSGTRATPEQRRALVRRFAASTNAGHRRCGSIALDALLQVHHFSSSGDFDFGARPRDWGWRPTINGDIWDWFADAIDLAVELSPNMAEARKHVAGSIGQVWQYKGVRDAVDRAATAFVAQEPWIDGWITARSALQLDGKSMPKAVRDKLAAIVERLKPTDLLNRARAIVLNFSPGGWELTDGDPDDGDAMRPYHKAQEAAVEVGRALAHDAVTRERFIAELLPQDSPPRAFECGRGLGQGAADLKALWQDLLRLFAGADPGLRNATVMGGFIHEAQKRDPAFVAETLDAVIDNDDLVAALPYLQARAGIDAEGLARLRRAISAGVLRSRDLHMLANGAVIEAPPEPLGALLRDMMALDGGTEIAIDILYMHMSGDEDKERPHDAGLTVVGRELLVQADLSKKAVLRDLGLQTLIRICCAGAEGEDSARRLCTNVRKGLETVKLSPHDLEKAFTTLLKTQPFIALDCFLLADLRPRGVNPFDADMRSKTPIESLDADTLCAWADIDPGRRYPLLAGSIPMFSDRNGDEGMTLSPLFAALLDRAPDKKAFLGDFRSRVQPGGWNGSLADTLVARKAELLKLAEGADPAIRAWIDDNQAVLDAMIERGRRLFHEAEESFE